MTGEGAYKISGGGNGGNYSAESVALIALGGLAIWGTTGVFTLTIIGVLAGYLAVAAILIGISLLMYEIATDPNQLWEERSQIGFIIMTALAPLSSVLTGTAGLPGVAGYLVETPFAAQIWSLVFQLIGTIIGLLSI